MAAPRGDRDMSALRPHKTCWTRQGIRPTLRLHTWDDGDINPFPESENTEHKAHRPQDSGRGTPREDPNAGGSGCGEACDACRLPQDISASQRIVEHAPMQYEGGTTHISQSKHVLYYTAPTTNGESTGTTTSPLNSLQKMPADRLASTLHNRANNTYL